MAIPIVIVPIALGIKYARYERELEHAERMKALELGQTLPGDESWWSPVRLCAGIGVGVPLVAFGCAFLVSMLGMPGPASSDCWHAAASVGLVGILGGTFLAHRHLVQREGSRNAHEDMHAKPEFDADAYDVVGRRG